MLLKYNLGLIKNNENTYKILKKDRNLTPTTSTHRRVIKKILQIVLQIVFMK